MSGSSFTENFVRLNNIQSHFEGWVFRPGMLFRAHEKWWGAGGLRVGPHEGLDLCIYRDKDGNEHHLTKGSLVPVIYGGKIVHIEDDFIGKSVYVAHDCAKGKEKVLYTIYGHIRPGKKILRGTHIDEGRSIGAIAEPAKGDFPVPAHLHISVALIAATVRPENLGWKLMSDSAVVTLQDPLATISRSERDRGSRGYCPKTVARH